MSGVLFMMRLWKYVDTKKLDNKSKANIFLIIRILYCGQVSLFCSALSQVSSVAIVPNGWSGQ